MLMNNILLNLTTPSGKLRIQQFLSKAAFLHVLILLYYTFSVFFYARVEKQPQFNFDPEAAALYYVL